VRDNYVGDEGDYAKYALLRAVSAHTGLRLGVNWYLTTHPEGNGDGGKLQHLTQPGWETLDEDLLRILRRHLSDAGAERSVKLIESAGVLPAGTLFHSESLCVESAGPQTRKVSYAEWHGRALTVLEEADVVFLDPDNGFQVQSVGEGAAKRCKYALDREVADYLARGQAVIGYQHRPHLTWADVFAGLAPRLLELHAANPVVVTFADRGFFLLARDDDLQRRLIDAAEALKQRLDGEGWTKLPMQILDGVQMAEQSTEVAATASEVEAAILADETLSAPDRKMLVGLYRRLREE
jgi:hypothetical protein